jgi:LPS export ABC transporter protein LptC
MRVLGFLVLVGCLAGCETKTLEIHKDYRGPMVMARNIHTVYTDSARPKIDVTAPIQNEYATGNRTFPKGITIWFYNEKGQKESKLTADRAYFDKPTEIYTGRGNVVVENMAKHERLKSEELKWSRFEKRVYTDKFVRIETPQETLLGQGLTAAQDFSTYKILKPKGVLPANRL